VAVGWDSECCRCKYAGYINSEYHTPVTNRSFEIEKKKEESEEKGKRKEKRRKETLQE